MIVRQFLQWSQTAPASQRADGASALARAYLYTDMEEQDRRDAIIALTSLLDDPSPLVRRSMAESLASASDAPHHIILALAEDQSDIAALVLSRSPLLTDSDLIDCAAVGDAFAQSAIALRPELKAPVAAALAEVGAREACISLAVNPGADVPEFSMRRIIERFGDDGEMREALLSRPWLPPSLRADLVMATASALSAFATQCGWMTNERAARVTREAQEKAHVIIAADTADVDTETLALAAHLRDKGQLTAGLMMRSLLSGSRGLFIAALSDLSGLPLSRVAGLSRDWRSSGFTALYRKAGLPENILPAFQAALACLHKFQVEYGTDMPARLHRELVSDVIDACENANTGELNKLIAVLRRLETEAAREDARHQSHALAMGFDANMTAIENRPDPEAIAAAMAEPPLRLSMGDGTVEKFDPNAVQIRIGDGPVTRASEIVIDFEALEAELMAA